MKGTKLSFVISYTIYPQILCSETLCLRNTACFANSNDVASVVSCLSTVYNPLFFLTSFYRRGLFLMPPLPPFSTTLKSTGLLAATAEVTTP
jgi:hypothetical protein